MSKSFETIFLQIGRLFWNGGSKRLHECRHVKIYLRWD